MSDPILLDDPSRELLLQDLRNWNESFWKNEAAGEGRIKFYMTLVTGVGGGLGALYQYGLKEASGTALRVAGELIPVALVGLLIFGWLTFTRMIRRNQVTDEYKEWGDGIRRYVLGTEVFEQIYGLKPKTPEARRLSHGGLTIMMLYMNALVAGVLVGSIPHPGGIESAWTAAMFAFIGAFAIQRRFLEAQQDQAREAYVMRRQVRADAARAKG